MAVFKTPHNLSVLPASRLLCLGFTLQHPFQAQLPTIYTISGCLWKKLFKPLDSHLHFDSWVWVVSNDLKVIKLEAVNVWDLTSNLQGGEWVRLPLKLLF